jgi:hypothetical protein
MNDRWTVQLPPQTYLSLAAYLQESGSGADASELAATAIDQWLAQARARAGTAHTNSGRGYQWKRLFLPSATRLRMNFDGKCHYAEVDGDEMGAPAMPGAIFGSCSLASETGSWPA